MIKRKYYRNSPKNTGHVKALPLKNYDGNHKSKSSRKGKIHKNPIFLN